MCFSKKFRNIKADKEPQEKEVFLVCFIPLSKTFVTVLQKRQIAELLRSILRSFNGVFLSPFIFFFGKNFNLGVVERGDSSTLGCNGEESQRRIDCLFFVLNFFVFNFCHQLLYLLQKRWIAELLGAIEKSLAGLCQLEGRQEREV